MVVQDQSIINQKCVPQTQMPKPLNTAVGFSKLICTGSSSLTEIKNKKGVNCPKIMSVKAECTETKMNMDE